jgi:hypothetical protein
MPFETNRGIEAGPGSCESRRDCQVSPRVLSSIQCHGTAQRTCRRSTSWTLLACVSRKRCMRACSPAAGRRSMEGSSATRSTPSSSPIASSWLLGVARATLNARALTAHAHTGALSAASCDLQHAPQCHEVPRKFISRTKLAKTRPNPASI